VVVVSSRQGISALEAQRDLGIGSYRTAWGMCRWLRWVLVRPIGIGLLDAWKLTRRMLAVWSGV